MSSCRGAGLRRSKKHDHASTRRTTTLRRAEERGRLRPLRRRRGGTVMARLYAAARLYVIFFQPSFKLKEKRREGARVIKRYHPPKTPFVRAVGIRSHSGRQGASAEPASSARPGGAAGRGTLGGLWTGPNRSQEKWPKKLILLGMVRSKGLEPSRLAALPPQGSASTNSATTARHGRLLLANSGAGNKRGCSGGAGRRRGGHFGGWCEAGAGRAHYMYKEAGLRSRGGRGLHPVPSLRYAHGR
jgi:hypothetical protein